MKLICLEETEKDLTSSPYNCQMYIKLCRNAVESYSAPNFFKVVN